VIVGVDVDIHDIKPADLKKNRYTVVTNFSGNEGTVFADIENKDMLKLLQMPEFEEHIDRVYQVLAAGEDDIDLTKVKMPKGKKLVASSWTRDHWGPDSVQGLLEFLGNDDESKRDFVKKLAAEFKIEKLELW
jgi:hypothetical protein